MPNYTEDYDAIGFDADHCLVKYNLQAYTRLLIKTDLTDLHECAGYPEDILDFDLSDDSKDIGICVNFGVFDIDRGMLLKLGEGKEILAAMKGRRVLGPEEIRALYGGPVPKFDALNWP